MYPNEIIRDEKEVLREQLMMAQMQIARLRGEMDGMWEMIECLYGKKKPAQKPY